MTWILVMTSVISNRSDFVTKEEALAPVGWKSLTLMQLLILEVTWEFQQQKGVKKNKKNMDNSDKWVLFQIKHIQWQCDSILQVWSHRTTDEPRMTLLQLENA